MSVSPPVPSASTPIPVTILTGFLGAGKTTLLNHLLRSPHGLRVAVLVNDFGAVNIDAQLVVGVEASTGTINLANGCICCTIRGDLLQAVLDLLERPERPDYILVETSGVSDPASVAATFMLAEIAPYVRLDAILTVVDAEQGADVLEDELYFLAITQIGVADIVILNKVDLVDAPRLERVRQWIREIIPRARILETTHAQVPPELVLGVGAYDPDRLTVAIRPDIHVHAADEVTDHDHDHGHEAPDHGSPDHSLVFQTWRWQSTEAVTLKAFKRALDSLPSTIYRVKGFVYLTDLPGHRGVLHVVGKRVSLTFGAPWGADEPRGTDLVVIGTHGGVDAAALAAIFTAALVSRQPTTLIGQMKENMRDWLRPR